MKPLLAAFVFVFFTSVAFAQGVERPHFDHNTRDALYLWQYTDVEGDPFLVDQWLSGTIIAVDGREFKNVKLKFDIYNNLFLFNRNDSAFQVTTPVAEVRITGPNGSEMVFIKGYAIGSSVEPQKFVQVIADGKISFIKYWNKTLDEYKEYGNANKLKRFNNISQFFAGKNGDFSVVKMNKKNLENLLADKWKEIDHYLNSKGLSAKDEAGWNAAVTYYNSL